MSQRRVCSEIWSRRNHYLHELPPGQLHLMQLAHQSSTSSGSFDGLDASKASAEDVLKLTQIELGKLDPHSPQRAAALLEVLRANDQLLRSAASIDALLNIAQIYYLLGMPKLGIEPAELAGTAAVLQASRPMQRKALTFEGGMLAECGNTPLALERYSAALVLANQLGDSRAEVALLNNIGLAFIYSALYADAIASLERSLELAGTDPSLAREREGALANIALACIHTEDLARGLRAARASINSGLALDNPGNLFIRVLSERNYVRLLTEVESLERARERCELAKGYARASGLERAELQASMAEGLLEVHSGMLDVGLSRLEGALEKCRPNPQSLRDALVVMVRAYEAAGQPERALDYLNELKAHTQRLQADNALFHHRLHLAKVEADSDSDWGATAGFFRRHERLIEGQQAQQKLLKAQIEQLERLAVTAELRDDSTGEHSYRVGRLAALLAREAGLDEQTCFTIDLAARLHDIGKIGIPDGILLKPGHLNAAEREIMETHTTVGAELLAKSDIPHMQVAEDIARHHHEWWAGGGYPAGISGEAIPIAARVTALADVFDALTHKRPYKEPWPVARALDEIQRLRGSQFDPRLTDIFIGLIHRLQREVGDLDEFLGAAARESSFNQARSRIAETLRRNPERRGYGRGLDPRL
ncbi:HD domain-containing phosphohydrolase [Piscinibacterium candidicorallinum]|uniref:HD domain-containing phosphohydrolase n=1 Tax=Piscinibacterium candidicorallinum TaxID=1793872 RepID=A0ABV7H832_9BURK